ncbi:hypothetical protein [Photobacterium sp. 1_MG-2023]|uniref:hypothetical protein n=1 Tax=Photobacterium sp. 1_MG-2023 TaxID=3062646 RepID=UPI0026E285A3|nr:hypothetical protein [Photobacterium sp. 1_MG-2023]MDO6705828.1 hypothetical protein [Photobacterium sp. 1_MG-2023]
MNQMKSLLTVLSLMFSASVWSETTAGENPVALVRSVEIGEHAVSVQFSDGRMQSIPVPHEVEFLDYSARFLDINFDGHSDLVIDDNLGANQFSEVFLFHPKARLFSQEADWEMNGLHLNPRRKLVCGRHRISNTQYEIQILKKGGSLQHVTFDYERNIGTSGMTRQSISREVFEALEQRCLN